VFAVAVADVAVAVVAAVFHVAFAAAADVVAAAPASAVAVDVVVVVVGVEHYRCCRFCYRDPALPLSHPRIQCATPCASVNSNCQANRTECCR